jgi:hypothetical protein
MRDRRRNSEGKWEREELGMCSRDGKYFVELRRDEVESRLGELE